MAAEHASIDMDDIAGLGGARAQALDHLRVAPGRHEADVLAVGLLSHGKPEIAGKLARLVLVAIAQGEAQERELPGRSGEQKIALVALLVSSAIELPPSGAGLAHDIMSGGKCRG